LATKRIDSLDGWRTISVCAVILSHVVNESALHIDGWLAEVIASYGTLGVKIFFVISGFVICRGMLAEHVRSDRVSIIGFYIRRFFRIIPPLALYLAVVCVLTAAHAVNPDAYRALLGLTFVCNLISNCGGYLGAHQWSLSTEEQFYLVVPVLFVLAGSCRVSIFTVLAFGLPLFSLFAAVLKWVDVASFSSTFICISVGVAASFHEERIRQACRSVPPSTLYVMIAVILLIAPQPPSRTTSLLTAFILPMCIAASLFMTMVTPSSFAQLLRYPAIVMIGRASYSIYLWQQLATYRFSWSSPSLRVALVCVSVAFCLVSFRFFERPLIARGARISEAVANTQSQRN
jgi:peptidoglycan/LPS O-acetylase OafA/YrhL